ncbi:hypothetical protein GCM10023116_15270 [Kistimonas scapharcae]|uniref:TraG N-terminal Proteobacteria domain-containing protein n=1 Tax=Kistimonas scapharcae TaxID=1036133 RepID=A0ABP8V1E3_9GAMM
MIWDIYSVGDSNFLYAVFNGVAMVVNDDGFRSMVVLGALLGVIGLSFHGLSQGGKFPEFQHLLIGFIIIYGGFYTTTSVAIHDVYTNEVKRVDNVPLAFAAGSIVTQAGRFLTEKFEQGFSTATMSNYGFVDPLSVLATVRQSTMYNMGMAEALTTSPTNNLQASWHNYIKECTLVGIDIGEKTPKDVYFASDFVEGLRFDHNVYGTEIYLGQREYKTCKEAYPLLKNATTGTTAGNIFTTLGKHLSLQPGETPKDRLGKAIQSLGLSAENAQKYVLASTLEPVFFDAAHAKYIEYRQPAYAAMVNDAINQRNTQWAAEGSLFMNIVRPMMAFMESFVFAITPLAAFLVVTGSKGVQLAGKYLILLIWIQLWQPLLAVVNLYILTVAGNELIALSAGSGFASLASIQMADKTLQTWLSMGGMMAASIPALSLMLIYGSAVTATSLMGRMQGGDFINEKKVSPDTMNAPPVLNHNIGWSGNQTTGFYGNGTPDAVSSLSTLNPA